MFVETHATKTASTPEGSDLFARFWILDDGAARDFGFWTAALRAILDFGFWILD